MTVRVADPEAPGASVRRDDVQEKDQPEGTAPLRLKPDAEHATLSRFVTDTVNGTAVPGRTAVLGDGLIERAGLARTHGFDTTYVAEAVAVSVVAAEFFAVAVIP